MTSMAKKKNQMDVIFFKNKGEGGGCGWGGVRGKKDFFQPATKKTHNTGGVKFQQPSVVEDHIPAKGLCERAGC